MLGMFLVSLDLVVYMGTSWVHCRRVAYDHCLVLAWRGGDMGLVGRSWS